MCADLIIKEERVSTQDGIQLANVAAVLSYQIRMENVSKMLAFDVSNYRTIIEDWAKRTMVRHYTLDEGRAKYVWNRE
jgi:hypothetical protein